MADLIGLYRSANGTFKELLTIPVGGAYDTIGLLTGPSGFHGTIDNLSVAQVNELTLSTHAQSSALQIQGNNSLASTGVTNATNLVTNGTFTTDTSGWLPKNATISVVGGVLRVTSDGNGVVEPMGYQAITTIPGHDYVLVVNALGGSIPFGAIGVGSVVGVPSLGALAGNGTSQTVNFTASATTTYVMLYIGSGTAAGDYCDFDDVVVQDLSAQVTLTLKYALTPANDNSAGQLDSVVVAISPVRAAGLVSASVTDDLILAPETAIIVQGETSSSQTTSPLLSTLLALVPAGENSASQLGAPTLSSKYPLVIGGSASLSFMDSLVLHGFIVAFTKIGFDPNTHNSLAVDPGTVAYKGSFYTTQQIAI